jgi:hypothetical protein
MCHGLIEHIYLNCVYYKRHELVSYEEAIKYWLNLWTGIKLKSNS